MSTKTEKVPYFELLVVVAIVVVIGLLAKKIFTPKGNEMSTPKPSNSSNSSNSSTGGINTGGSLQSVGSNTILKRGMKAREIEWLQHYYNINISPKFSRQKLVKDGIFGPKTEEAVMFVTSSKTTTWNNFKQKVDSLNTNLANLPDYWPNMI